METTCIGCKEELKINLSMNIFGFEFYKKAGSADIKFHKGWSWKPAKLDLIKNPKKLLNFNSSVEIFQPQKLSRGYALLLSKKNTAVGSVISELKKSKKPFVYLNWDEFVGEGVVLYDSSEKKYIIKYKKHSFDLSKVKSVYCDYTNISEVFHFKRAKFNNKEKVFLSRWIEALQTLEYILNEKKWYPAKPSQMKYESQNKFGELVVAQKMGIKIPKMIYTNDAREAQKFLKDCPAIMKESGLKFFEDSRGNIQIFESQKIDAKNKKISQVGFTPCLFQEFIDKKYDVRTTVVGKKALSVKIDSQKDKKTANDWRGNEHLTPMTPYKLPKAVEKKLIQLQKKLGFELSTFDLVVDQKGNHFLLEMNRPGQWLYMEALAGVPITKTLALNL
jgi:glutathione synthase/RimK-type ligase-like ATP-grasp enzyme